MPQKRFYYERDGGPGGKEHYVVDTYANSNRDHRRREVNTRAEGLKLARKLNTNPDGPRKIDAVSPVAVH